MNKANFLKAIVIIALISFAIYSCKKDASLRTGNAIIINEGPIETDGCGWMLKIDSAYYSPTNLSDEFKTNNASVRVTYYLLSTKFSCGLAATKFPQIEIKTIKNKNN